MLRQLAVFTACLMVLAPTGRAAAWELPPDDHDRPELSAAEEAAWLQALLQASPHRQAMVDAPAHAGEAPGPLGAADGAYHQKLGA